jgi:uroporphyrinogen III methyltransferase/synthase
MGAAVLEQVTAGLQAAGWPADTPAAIVERGTLPWERRVRGPLGQLAALAEHAAVSSPALMVVGAAAAVDPGVPTRARILFTGLDPENFRALGDLLHWPALACVSDQEGQRLLPGILLRLQERAFPWIAFDSARAVTSFLAALARYNLDLRALAGLAVVALGRSASLRLRELGLRADVCGNTVDLLHNLQPAAPQPGLLVHGTHASRDFAAQLEEAGVRAVELSLLSVVPNPELGRPLPSHDVIYFVSPSGVHSYWSVYGAPAFREQAWCLGEQTQRALRQYGVTARIVAPQTVSFCGVARLGEFAGLATASSRRFSRRGRRG